MLRTVANPRGRFDLALLGAEGIDGDGVWNSQAEIVALQRAVIERSR